MVVTLKCWPAATLVALAATVACPAQQSKILYPKARFAYAYPGAKVGVERYENAWFEQSVVPKGSIRTFHTWPVPVAATPLPTFGDGPHVVYTKQAKADDQTVHFSDFVAAWSERDDYAFKVEVGHHRTEVWGIVHSWRYHEWSDPGDVIPEDHPVWAMYEHIFSGVEAGKGVWSKTHAFRVSHLRVDGAGEEFVGEISDYLGAGQDNVKRSGLSFRRRNVNFSVDVSLRGPRPVATWHRGGREGGWRQDSVHSIGHSKDWRKQVDELHDNPPKRKPRESDLFALIGSKKRGMKPARVCSILDFKGWSVARKTGVRPGHVLGSAKKGKRKRRKFVPKQRNRVGFVRKAGTRFVFVCKELGLKLPLEVPADLLPLLEAWVANFP